MIFELMGKKLISYDPSGNLRENFEAFIQGLISFPLEIPGTAYYKCLQVARQMILLYMHAYFIPSVSKSN